MQVIFRVNAPVKISEVAEIGGSDFGGGNNVLTISYEDLLYSKLELPLHLKKADFAGGRK